MIALTIAEVRGAEVGGADGLFWVTLRFGNRDRAVIHTRSRVQALALAIAINGDVDAAFKVGDLPEGEVRA